MNELKFHHIKMEDGSDSTSVISGKQFAMSAFAEDHMAFVFLDAGSWRTGFAYVKKSTTTDKYEIVTLR